MKLTLIACLALLAQATFCQQQVGPFLVDNPKLKDFLVTKVYPVECEDATSTAAYKDMRGRGAAVWKVRVNRVLSEKAADFTTNPFVLQAIQAAIKEQGTVKDVTNPASAWNQTDVLKTSQETVYAVADDTSVDYFHFEFHLNMQGRQPSNTDEYIKALKSFMCLTQKDWIKTYFSPAMKVSGQ